VALDRGPVAGGAAIQAVALAALRDGGRLSLAFLAAGLLGGAVAGAFAPPDGRPWFDGFLAGAIGLGLYLLWVVALGVRTALGTGDVGSAGFLAISVGAWVALLVGPLHAVGAAVVDTARQRVGR